MQWQMKTKIKTVLQNLPNTACAHWTLGTAASRQAFRACVASSFFYSKAESTPTHLPVPRRRNTTQTIGNIICHRYNINYLFDSIVTLKDRL
jgi:hypothetical protein